MADQWAQFKDAGSDPWAQFSDAPAAKPAPKPAPKRSLSEDVGGFMANVNRGLGVGDEMAGGLNMLSNVVSGRSKIDPRNILGSTKSAFDQGMADQRGIEDSYAAAHPNLAALARGTGNALTMIAPSGQSANALALTSRAGNMLRGATTAGLAAAGYAAADRGTVAERTAAAGEAARNPVVLGLGAVAGAVGPAASKPAKPKYSPDVVALRDKGVQLTPGQARGGVAKATEDALTSTPILGTAIQDARRSGLESYNKAAGNEALASVGETVPDHIRAGHDTVAYVEDRLGKLYDQTIPNRSIAVDDPFKAAIQQRLGDIVQDMTPEGRDRLAKIIDQRLTSRLGDSEAVSGEMFQRINSELSTVKKRFSGSQDADQRAIADGLDVIQQEMRAAAARQDPDFAARKQAVDQGYAMFKRLQSAAASPGAEGGVATAAQFGGAVRRADKSVDKGNTAAGRAYGQDFADAGRAVLPSKTPDSGTATRGAIAMGASAPGAIIAPLVSGHPMAAAGVAAGYGATLGGLKLASKAYSPEAISAFNAALDGRISAQQQQSALSELRRLALSDPRIAGLYREAASRLARTTGVIAAPRNTLAGAANSAQ